MLKPVLSFLIFFVCACTNNTATSTAAPDTAASSQTIHTNVTDTVVTGAKPLVLAGCYQMIVKQDTASLKLQVKDTIVAGDLTYDWHEKDRSTGTLQGVLRNDTIFAAYTFASEGRTSVREVLFKISEGALLEGFGNLTEQNGKLVFQDRSTLQFQNNNPFLKVPCR